MTLYLMVTMDKYELPIAVAESPGELAEMLGVKKNTIMCLISRAKKENRNFCYKRIEIEEDIDDD